MKVKDFVRSRANGRCEYCLTPDDFSTDAFTLDHIQPMVLGGSSHSDNLAYACQSCNSRKQDAVSAFDRMSQEVVRLYSPRLHKWTEHFSWSLDGFMIVPAPAIGRATIDRLALNRPYLVRLRAYLLALELHPMQDKLPDPPPD